MIVLFSLIGMFLMFYLLAKVCDQYFVRSLEIIAKKWHLAEDVAGATLMAIGSSAPEFFTSVIALGKIGAHQIGAGTIVGSAIFNILVIVGVVSVLSPVRLHWRPVLRDLLFYTGAIIILLLTFQDGKITVYEAVLYVLVYVLYILLLIFWRHKIGGKKNNITIKVKELEKQEQKIQKKSIFIQKPLQLIDQTLAWIIPDLDKKRHAYWRVFFFSIVIIATASWALIEFAIIMARGIGIPEVIIALTILAAGTSIPDLVSSVIVAKRGKGGMAVSNAVGSNIFDILIGLGVPWFVYTAFFHKSVVVGTENLFSSIVLLLFTVITLLFLLVSQKFKIGSKSGYLLLAIYLIYLGYAIYGAYVPAAWSVGEFVTVLISS